MFFKLLLFSTLFFMSASFHFLNALTVEEAEKFPAALVEEIVYENGFDGEQGKKIKLPPGFSFAAGEGPAGTAALKYERNNSADYKVLNLNIPKLVPGVKYQAQIQLRTNDLKTKRIRALAIEFSKNGKYATGYYPDFPNPGNEFQTFEFDFTLMQDTSAYLALYLTRGETGTVWFDNLRILRSGSARSAILTYPPNLNFLDNSGIFKIHAQGANADKLQALIHLEYSGGGGGKILVSPDRQDNFVGNFGAMPAGSARMTVQLIDPQRKEKIVSQDYRMTVLDKQSVPANAVTRDRFGRLTVDGKPFMPLGVFMATHKHVVPLDKITKLESLEVDLKKISESGFNCVLDYFTLWLGEEFPVDEQLAQIRAGLDLMQKYGLKAIFSLKDQIPSHGGLRKLAGNEGKLDVALRAVREFKDHPALLAWYVADEPNRKDIADVAQMREKINALDPWHPTWAVTYHYTDFPYFGTASDVTGVDPYPITYLTAKANLRKICDAMIAAHSTGLPVWAVPQIFNSSVYRKNITPDEFAISRKPSPTEIRAMPLLCLINGAEGFIFYAYHSVIYTAEKLKKGSADEEWPHVAEMCKMMKSLEPFALSQEKSPRFTIKSIPSGKVQARVFKQADGKTAVVIVGLEGKAEAEIKIPGNSKLKSQYGLTRMITQDTYLFRCDDVDADILFD